MRIDEHIFHPALQGTMLNDHDNATQGASREDSWEKPIVQSWTLDALFCL